MGIFSCKNGLPVGKKHILREIVNQFDPSWLKGIYCGAYLNGADFPTFGMIAELRAESFASIGALSAKVKERFPESELWVTADFGWRRASCAVGMSVSSKPEDDALAGRGGVQTLDRRGYACGVCAQTAGIVRVRR